MQRCNECGGRLDRPGLYRCEESGHPQPDLAQRIVAVIERDLNDRRGLHIDSLSDELQDEIRDHWTELVRAVILE